MAAKWLVHLSHNRVLGPWSSSRVRRALREGQIDPFDKVSKVGSSIEKEIIEVDEIFSDNSHETPKKPNQDGKDLNFSAIKKKQARKVAKPPIAKQASNEQFEAFSLTSIKKPPVSFDNSETEEQTKDFDTDNHKYFLESDNDSEVSKTVELDGGILKQAKELILAKEKVEQKAFALANIKAEAKAYEKAKFKAQKEIEAKFKSQQEIEVKAKREIEAQIKHQMEIRALEEAKAAAEIKIQMEMAALSNEKARLQREAEEKAQLIAEAKFAALVKDPPAHSPLHEASEKRQKEEQQQRLQPKGMLALADPNYEDTSFLKPKHQFFAKKKVAQKGPQSSGSKHYLAVNPKGYIYGPMSSDEIIRNFKNGTFGREFFVKSGASGSQTPIEKFIRKASSPGYRSKLPTPKFSPVMSPNEFVPQKKSNFGFILGLVIILAFAFIYKISSHNSSTKNRKAATTLVRQNEKAVPKQRTKQRQNSQVSKQVAPLSAPTKRVTPKPNSSSNKAMTSKRTPTKIRSRKSNSSQKTYNKHVTYRKTPEPRRSVAMISNTPRTATPQQAPVFSTPAQTKRSFGQNGEKVTLGPMSFIPRDLDSCGMKCELMMRDANGNPIKVKFFKGQFADKLSTKSVNITITGRIADNGHSLLLSTVK